MKTQELLNLALYFCPRLKGKVLVVHASLTSKQRDLVASMLRSNQLIIAIATSAFEMGIDCKLRRVICYDDGGTQLRSIESHTQRDGRIGRDKDDIECEILSIFTFLSIPKDQKIAENTKSIRQKLSPKVRIKRGERVTHYFRSDYFDTSMCHTCVHVRVCLCVYACVCPCMYERI